MRWRRLSTIGDFIEEINISSGEILGRVRARVNCSSHFEESGGVTGFGLFFLRFERASHILPNGLREAKFSAIVIVIARGFKIKGSFASGATGERATALKRDCRIAKIIEILSGIEESINKPLNALSCDDNRPSDFFLITKDIPAEDALHGLLNKAIIAVEVVETATISIGEEESANKITNRNLAGAELGFEERLAVSGESMEKDLAIGGLNEDIQFGGREKIISREDAGLVITGDSESSDARVLGRR
jgi:hypothetical protein